MEITKNGKFFLKVVKIVKQPIFLPIKYYTLALTKLDYRFIHILQTMNFVKQ